MHGKNSGMPAVPLERRFFSKKDVFIIVAVLLIAAVGFVARSLLTDRTSAVEAEIYYNTKMVRTAVLRPGLNETFAVPGQPDVVLQVTDGKIRFYTSTCKDKICIRAGFLSQPGESAACLPNKVAVKLVALGNSSSGGLDTYIS